jgi:hypothetical protein
MEEQALRYNQNKPKWSLIHYGSLEPLVRVMEYGAVKYAPENWKKGLDNKAVLESLMRHLVKLMDGEKYDQESGLQHIGHIMANAMFYSYFDNKLNENKEGSIEESKETIN